MKENLMKILLKTLLVNLVFYLLILLDSNMLIIHAGTMSFVRFMFLLFMIL